MHSSGGANDDLGGRLAGLRDQFLLQYEGALGRAGSALLAQPEARKQCLQQAEQVFADVCASLTAGTVVAQQFAQSYSRDVGASRAAANTHPSESLRAATVLCDVVLDALEQAGPTDPGDAMLAARSLVDSVMTRVRQEAVGYASLLLGEIHRAHVSERRRIALELHDRVGSGISVATRCLELHDHYVRRDPGRALAKVAQAEEVLQDVMDSVRQVTMEMRAQARVEGLQKALQGCLDALSPAGTNVTLVVNGDDAWAPPDVLDEVYLVLREAVRNALAHSRASSVGIRVDIAPRMMSAEVKDDGVGFTPERAWAEGAGLASMRERIGLVGGTVSLSSYPGAGTTMALSIPLDGERHE